jgi:hypothetical protein
MVWKRIRITMQLIIYVGQRLFINMVLHRHVCIVFLPISNLPKIFLHHPSFEITSLATGKIPGGIQNCFTGLQGS